MIKVRSGLSSSDAFHEVKKEKCQVRVSKCGNLIWQPPSHQLAPAVIVLSHDVVILDSVAIDNWAADEHAGENSSLSVFTPQQDIFVVYWSFFELLNNCNAQLFFAVADDPIDHVGAVRLGSVQQRNDRVLLVRNTIQGTSCYINNILHRSLNSMFFMAQTAIMWL